MLPAEADVRLDDLPLGTAGALGDEPLRLANGVHVLETRGSDGEVEHLVFSVEPDQELLLEVDLGAEDPRERSRWTDRRQLPRRTGD